MTVSSSANADNLSTTRVTINRRVVTIIVIIIWRVLHAGVADNQNDISLRQEWVDVKGNDVGNGYCRTVCTVCTTSSVFVLCCCPAESLELDLG